MPHPQNSPRGLWAKKQVNLAASGGIQFDDYSTSAKLLTANAAGLLAAGAVAVSGQATIGKLSANSTALLLPATGAQFAALTSLIITSNSTGIKIGARYISTNTTGNSTT